MGIGFLLVSHVLSVRLHELIGSAFAYRFTTVIVAALLTGVLMAFSGRAAASEGSSSTMFIRARILPRIEFTVSDEVVTVKANVEWSASGQTADGTTVRVTGDGVSRIRFPEGTKDITVLAE